MVVTVDENTRAEVQTPRSKGASGKEAETTDPKRSRGRITSELLDELVALVPRGNDQLKTIAVEVPFTGETLGEVPRCTAATIATAARRARRAQEVWAGRSFSERAKVLMRYHDLILDRQEEILDLIQLETGKARAHAFEEIADVAMVSRYYALNSERHLAPRRRRGALPGLTSTKEIHHPLGVVGIIAPWNYPLTLSVTDALAALMAGNGVVLKPDQQTPFTALWAVRLLRDAGLPYDLFQVVTGSGSELGTPLIEQVDYITFTGSTRTGRIIAREAGQNLIGCSLELGGKNSMIIAADADLDEAAEGALRGSFSNTGQLCISIERLYIERSIFDRFLRRFVALTERMTLGPELSYDLDLGSLASADQLATVDGQVKEALAMGAVALAGGRARPDLGPYFYEPTILTRVDEAMTLCCEETFGPVVAVYPFDDIDEAIERTNDTRYGLNASIFSADTGRAERWASRIEAGTVNINEAYAAAWASMDAPMGGFKDSGLGRRHGAEGILKYTQSQTIAVQRLLPFGAPEGMPEEAYSRVLSGALRVLKRIPGIR